MANTTNFNWETPDDTDLVKDGALAIRTLGSAIDTSLVDLKGGTTGQVLAKASNTDMDFTWATDAAGIPATIFDAKGDIIAASAADTAARLAVGANNTVLTADSSTATGLKWAAAAGGGKVLQVVQGTVSTNTTSSSTSFVDVSLSASITPSLSSSKVLVLVSAVAYAQGSSGFVRMDTRLVRGSTEIAKQEPGVGQIGGSIQGAISYSFLDSPSTTSATTYKIQAKKADNADDFIFNYNSSNSTITLMEIGA
jgi:hypothetical protein